MNRIGIWQPTPGVEVACGLTDPHEHRACGCRCIWCIWYPLVDSSSCLPCSWQLCNNCSQLPICFLVIVKSKVIWLTKSYPMGSHPTLILISATLTRCFMISDFVVQMLLAGSELLIPMSSLRPLPFDTFHTTTLRIGFNDPITSHLVPSHFLNSSSSSSNYHWSAATTLCCSALATSSLAFFCIAGINPTGIPGASHDTLRKKLKR